jgi:ATP synthase protein I
MAEVRRSEKDCPTQANPEKQFGREVERKAARKLRARREANRGAWFWLGMFGLVGWSVAVPTVIGIALGVWLDHKWPSDVSWTLTMLLAGVVVGALNAWYWIQQESHRL